MDTIVYSAMDSHSLMLRATVRSSLDRIFYNTSSPDGLKPRSRCLPQVVDRFSQCPRHPTPYPHHLVVQARVTPHHRNPLPHHHNPLSHPRNLTPPRSPHTTSRPPASSPHRTTSKKVKSDHHSPWHHLRQNSRNLSPKNFATMPGSSTQRGSLGCSPPPVKFHSTHS